MSCTLTRGMISPLRQMIHLRQYVKNITSSSTLYEIITVKNNDEFIDKVMNSDRPVIVNFHADWCDPCKILTPRLKELIGPLANVDLAILDVEDHVQLVHEFEVKAVPAVIGIRDGMVKDKFIGLVDAEMIESLIAKMNTPPRNPDRYKNN